MVQDKPDGNLDVPIVGCAAVTLCGLVLSVIGMVVRNPAGLAMDGAGSNPEPFELLILLIAGPVVTLSIWALLTARARRVQQRLLETERIAATLSPPRSRYAQAIADRRPPRKTPAQIALPRFLMMFAGAFSAPVIIGVALFVPFGPIIGGSLFLLGLAADLGLLRLSVPTPRCFLMGFAFGCAAMALMAYLRV